LFVASEGFTLKQNTIYGNCKLVTELTKSIPNIIKGANYG